MAKSRRIAKCDVAAAVSESSRQVAELAALRRMLAVSEGTFSLSFAVFNTRRLRDELIAVLTAESPRIVKVALPPQTTDALVVARERVAATDPAVIFILDLEESLAPHDEPSPILRSLNASRELWEQFHCPVVFWVAERTARLMASQCIDFWRYRSHAFEFTAEVQQAGQWQSESFPGYDMIAGLPYEAKRFRRAELEHRLDQLDSPPPETMLAHVLDWMYKLAALHKIFSDWQASETILRDALKLSEENYGPDAPMTAVALNDLALLLQAKNRLAEAEPLMRHALAIDEQSYGAEHPTVAIRLNNLARLLHATNRLAEAEPLMGRAVEILRTSLGEEHPWTVMGVENYRLLREAMDLASK